MTEQTTERNGQIKALCKLNNTQEQAQNPEIYLRFEKVLFKQ